MNRFRANAKINLWLRVVGRRADGFHDIETVFQSVSLADEIEVNDSDAGVFIAMTSDEAPHGTIPTEDNLVHRAALALKEEAGVERGARIDIVKRIPTGGGLAGGSADAAAAIVGLNELWRADLDEERLIRLAAGLGSDTAFCIRGGTAIGRGRGEELTFLDEVPELWVVLGLSFTPLLTREVYSRCSPGPPGDLAAEEAVQALRARDVEKLASLLRNDLEPATMSLRPELEGHKDVLLRAGAMGALVSGSGPTVFGLCGDSAHAVQVAERCRSEGPFDRVVAVPTRGACVERFE